MRKRLLLAGLVLVLALLAVGIWIRQTITMPQSKARVLMYRYAEARESGSL
jgi:hypothetical protein